MTLFILLNWVLCLCTALFLIVIFWRYRFLFIKPSVIVVLFFHLRIQWAAVLKAGFIEKFLIQPYSFLILVHLFPLLGLTVSFFIWHKQTISIFSRLKKFSFSSFYINKKVVFLVFIIIIIISAYYFVHVSVSQTGLFAIFTNPEASTQAREMSLKLVSNPIVRYSYSFLKNAFAPFLSVLLFVLLVQNLRRNFSQTTLIVIMLSYILIIVSITGARAPAASVALTLFWAFFLTNGMRVRPVYIFLAFVLILASPVLITILREGRSISPSLFTEYFGGAIFKRLFLTPMETGLYHVHYAQVKEFFGIASIPKLAAFFGIQPVIAPNVIYLKYMKFSHHLESGLANTSYVFSYYSYFGIFSFFFSLLGLWLLDFSVMVFKRIKSDSVLLACVASIFSASIGFIAADYTTVLITNGFLLILIISLLVDRIQINMER